MLTDSSPMFFLLLRGNRVLLQMNRNGAENPEIIVCVVAGANTPLRPSIQSLGLLKELASSCWVGVILNIFWPPEVKIELYLGIAGKGSNGRAEITPFNTS